MTDDEFVEEGLPFSGAENVVAVVAVEGELRDVRAWCREDASWVVRRCHGIVRKRNVLAEPWEQWHRHRAGRMHTTWELPYGARGEDDVQIPPPPRVGERPHRVDPFLNPPDAASRPTKALEPGGPTNTSLSSNEKPATSDRSSRCPFHKRNSRRYMAP